MFIIFIILSLTPSFKIPTIASKISNLKLDEPPKTVDIDT